MSVIKERLEELEDRIEDLEEALGLDDMSDNEGNVGSVGSGNVGSGNVGVGSTAPAGTTETEPDTAVDGGQSDPAPAPGNVGVGSTAPDPDFS